jgi:two-component system, chemotaxis family, chemotaxis protein CheY
MKILLIDDSRLSRRVLMKTLGDDFTYLEASSGLSGLEAYMLERPDLVILDLNMPEINGLEVLAKIRELDPDSRVIVGTADIQEYSRRQAEELGATGFITKPFQPEEVQEIVQRVLAKAG